MNKISDGRYAEQVYNHSISINEVSKLRINSSFSVPVDQHCMGETEANDAKCIIDVPCTWWPDRVKECKNKCNQNKNYSYSSCDEMQDPFPRVIFVEQWPVDRAAKERTVLG